MTTFEQLQAAVKATDADYQAAVAVKWDAYDKMMGALRALNAYSEQENEAFKQHPLWQTNDTQAVYGVTEKRLVAERTR